MILCKRLAVIVPVLFLLTSTFAIAEEKELGKPQNKTEIFADDFSAQILSDAWKGYKSDSKIVKGVLNGLMPKDAGHNAVDSVLTDAYSDVEIALDFRFSGSKLFVVAFNEHRFKGTHAGHICRAVVTPGRIILRDGKTGNFSNKIFAMKKAGGLDEKTKQFLKTKETSIKNKLEQEKWYQLLVRIQGDVMTVFIDGKKIGELKSEGISHAKKNKLSLVTSKQAMQFDNLKILAP